MSRQPSQDPERKRCVVRTHSHPAQGLSLEKTRERES